MKRYMFFCVVATILASCTKESKDDVTVNWDDYNAATPLSSATANKIYEYKPAPGQFINESAEFTTETLAIAGAMAQWQREIPGYVSLGGFGGYIVVGFDHSIPNARALSNSNKIYDFHIKGNPFPSSSEPGIVYVMQDKNNNERPDDTWYELKGSEHGAEGTIQGYEVTYYKPTDNPNVRWTDNREGEGTIDYDEVYHPQRTYYPTWIAEESYTLKGIRLEDKTVEVRPGYWENQNYQWGYADNFGTDLVNPGTPNATNGFKISNAVDAEGNAVNLKFIDFIKVQNGVNSKAGPLGEVSTEVFGFVDAHMLD